MRRYLFGLIVALMVSGISWTAVAQQNENTIGFSISPAIIDVAAEPSKSFTTSLTFLNTSDVPVGARIEAETLIPIDDVIDQSRRDEFDASSWISFSDENLVFEPNESNTIAVTVTVPKTANPGGHYALVTLKPGVIQLGGEQTNTRVLPQVSASVLITVPGEVVNEASIVSDDLQLARVTRGSTNVLSFRIRNTGNTHILPAPRLTISSDDGPVDILALQPQLVLPNTEKVFSIDWKADVDYGNYKIVAETVYGGASVPLVSDAAKFLVIPPLWQVLLVTAFLPLSLYIVIKYRNIPRFISVLQGNSFLARHNYSNMQADSDKTPTNKTDPLNEVARELEKEPSILGMPDDDMLFDDIDTKTLNPSETTPTHKRKPLTTASAILENSHTHIVQTKSSTIVRMVPVAKTSLDMKPTKIVVSDHDDPANNATKHATKRASTSKKKPVNPKKSQTKKSLKKSKTIQTIK